MRADSIARFGLLAGPFALALTLSLPWPGAMPAGTWATLGVTVWMAVWWATEPIPIPATSLLPLVLLPTLGLLGLDEAAAAYGNPIVFLFLGGFLLALSMERWNLHKRMALLIVIAQAPGAYKDVSAVVDVADAAGLARKVSRLEPFVCVKG